MDEMLVIEGTNENPQETPKNRADEPRLARKTLAWPLSTPDTVVIKLLSMIIWSLNNKTFFFCYLSYASNY